MKNVKWVMLILIIVVSAAYILKIKSGFWNLFSDKDQFAEKEQRRPRQRLPPEEFFNKMDADNNALISETEAEGRLKESFENVDTDNDGYVSLKEFMVVPTRPNRRSKNINVHIPEDDGETVSRIHPAFADFNPEAVTVYLSEDKTDYVIESTGLPNHETVYWGEGNDGYKEEPNVRTTPSRIPGRDVSATITVDATPNLSGITIDTELGIMGIAVSGAYIFNNEEGRGVMNEAIPSLDWTAGHIGPSVYHYHLEPKAFTNDDDNLVGILNDGVFIYGRKCISTGSYPTDLDVSGGHVSPTQHNAKGEYHYHIINEVFANSGTYMLFEGPFQGY